MEIGVLNYNGLNYTIACMESLFLANPLPRRIVLIDNASGYGLREGLKRKYVSHPRVDLFLT